MNKGRDVWIEILERVFPDLGILLDNATWLTGQFEKPCAYMETDTVYETAYRANANQVMEDVGIVFHFESAENPFDISPLHEYLRQERFSVASPTQGIMLNMESPKYREHNDRIEMTCRYTYLIRIPDKSVQKLENIIIDAEGFIDE
jgi:hypothetical protein